MSEYCEWYEKHTTDLTEDEREMCPGYGRSCASCAYLGEAEEGET